MNHGARAQRRRWLWRGGVLVAILAASVEATSCHPVVTVRNLMLASADRTHEKKQNDVVIIDDGYGRACKYTNLEGAKPDRYPPACDGGTER